MSSTLRRRLLPYLLMGPGLLWLLLFFAVPLGFMADLSLRSGTIDTGFTPAAEFGNYVDSLSQFDTQFLRSFKFAGIATVLALLIGYPLAYAIAFKGGRYKNLLLFAVVAPFFTTYLIRTIAWQTILSDDSPTVDVLRTLSILGDDGRLLATDFAVIAGITYNFLPFMVLPIYASLERMDQRLIEGAKDLYSSASSAFWRVTLPLSAPGVVAGTLLTFIPAAGDYVNSTFLGGPQQSMIGNVVQSLYNKQLDYPFAAALSFTLMAIILVIVLIYVRWAGTEALMDEEGAK